MVTIVKHSDNTTPDNIVILDTIEDGETFLDQLSGSYWGLPGFLAKREPGRLIVSATVVGGTPRILSTYTIEDAA